LASRIQAIVFDRTGTLTVGKPRITDVVAPSVTEDELLRLAAAAEARSSHPLAQTVLDEVDRRGIGNDLTVDEFESLAGFGIRAHVAGREVLVGAQRLLERYTIRLGGLQLEVDRLLSEGKTLVLVAIDGQVAGVLAAADTVRPSAAQAIADLKAIGIEPVCCCS
jgi:P-type E1-E2 ATPase